MPTPGITQDLQIVYNIVLSLITLVSAVGAVAAAMQGKKNAESIAQVHTIVNGNNSALQTTVQQQAETIGAQREKINANPRLPGV